jgi:hypothetical protein
MLGWGRRKDAQAVEAMREQLAAADMHARSVLAAVAQTDTRWTKDREDRARVQLSTEGALERMTAAYADNTADITRSLHHISEMCSLVAEKLEADRMERHELTAAINELKRLLSSPLETPSQVLGGMVYSSHEPVPVTEIVRNGDARFGEHVKNGNGNGNGVPFNGTVFSNGNGNANGGNGNGNGSGSGAYGAEPRVEEIVLSDYEEPVSPFGTAAPARDHGPFGSPEIVEPAEAIETAQTTAPPPERFGRWDAVPPPRPAQPVAVVDAPAAPPVAMPVAPIVEPAPVVEPARQYDAFAGLPLLTPTEAPRTFGTVVSPPPAPVTPEPVVAGTPAPDAVSGLDRQWNDSHRLTEANPFRPQGGTRLTPRRSSTRTPSH